MQRLEVNAALQNLLERKNIPEACAIVIKYGSTLEEFRGWEFEIDTEIISDFTEHKELDTEESLEFGRKNIV